MIQVFLFRNKPKQNKGIHFLYCKQNRHFYLDLSSEKYGTPLLY
jgi:hypothetical protein